MAKIERALISVSNKQGVVDFAQGLVDMGVEILSTGGTAKMLRAADLPVVEVADYTGFAEMMDGRVKTLHPKIHGGILARRDNPEHLKQIAQQQIPPIDMVVVNLYPFQQTVARPDCDLATAIEQIDIGGPTMLRAAAKNCHGVTVVVESSDYQPVLQQMRENDGGTTESMRLQLATRAFAHSAGYEAAIASWLQAQQITADQPFAESFQVQMRRHQTMRYGENPHQQAAFYRETDAEFGVAACEQRQGKALSFNNVADADAALECVAAFDAPSCVIVKHANPCGVASAGSPAEAYELAYSTDTTSAFGGIIAFNRPIDAALAQTIIDRQFLEVLLVPEMDAEVAAVFAEKPNVRVLVGSQTLPAQSLNFKRVNGGLLVQSQDFLLPGADSIRVVTQAQPTDQQLKDLLFAATVGKFVKSNAIVFASNGRTLGIGAGQMSRVDSTRIAALKAADAGLDMAEAVVASDAFFPFRDGIDRCAEAGARAIIQPGGSMRDEEVIAAADDHGMAMVFTGARHFRH
ncbi:MAG: bifunctional phosphoribosylaminoimidazolecarboxamide formyltransferase/IMP cyclohydrolase [Gammaproteobacteria bacterium]